MRALLRRTTAVPAVAFVVLATAALALGPDATAAGQTRSATAHLTVFVRATERATVSVTESATATVAGFTATSRATAARSAAATAGAWGTAGARAVARASRPALAVARARSMASSVARHRATARARATAARRAALDARRSARASAIAAARAAATARARAAAGAAYSAYLSRTNPKPSPTPAPSANCGGQTPAKPGGGTYVCSFDDEFNGTSLNPAAWTVVTTANAGTGEGGVCYVDSPNNISVGGGYLSLTVRKLSAPMTCAAPAGSYSTSYTGGNVATWGKFSQAYGRFAVRASFPASTVAGLQSSLWLYPQTLNYGAWPLSGEIDIAEEYSQYADRAIPYLHYGFDPSTTNSTTNTNIVTNNYCMVSDVHAFHEYVVDWSPGTLTISFDGQTCLVDNYVAAGLSGAAPFDSPFFVALTQALGSTTNALTASTPLPATTRVDYVRVWK